MKKRDGFPGQMFYVIPEKILELVKQKPLISDLYITDIGYYPGAKNHFRERKDGIPQSILIYNTDGKGFIRIGERIYELEADHFFLIPSNVPHLYYADQDDPWSIYWVHFTGSKAGLFTKEVMQPISIERNISSRVSERIALFDEIFRNLDRGYSIETLEYINLCLYHLLASFFHIDQFCLKNESRAKDYVGKSISFMLENLNKNLKLEEIASAIQLSVSHYSRIFADRTGHSPIDYFIQLKIQKSCRLLDNTNLSIAEIARESGFDDQFYFSRLFRKVMNMSPRDYRKR